MKTAIKLDIVRLLKASEGSDEMLDMFKDTPIFDLLRQRRNYARMLNSVTITQEHIEIMTRYNKEIAAFFHLI